MARINLVVALVLTKFWFSNTNGADAPYHQLIMYKDLLALRPQSPKIVDAALTRLQSHLWYVSEEITPLALTSSFVSNEERVAMAEVTMDKNKLL